MTASCFSSLSHDSDCSSERDFIKAFRSSVWLSICFGLSLLKRIEAAHSPSPESLGSFVLQRFRGGRTLKTALVNPAHVFAFHSKGGAVCGSPTSRARKCCAVLVTHGA